MDYAEGEILKRRERFVCMFCCFRFSLFAIRVSESSPQTAALIRLLYRVYCQSRVVLRRIIGNFMKRFLHPWQSVVAGGG